MLRRQPKQNDQSRTSPPATAHLHSSPLHPPPPPAHPALMVKCDFRWKTRSSPVSCRHSCSGLTYNLMPRILYHRGGKKTKQRTKKQKQKASFHSPSIRDGLIAAEWKPSSCMPTMVRTGSVEPWRIVRSGADTLQTRVAFRSIFTSRHETLASRQPIGWAWMKMFLFHFCV